ncbi:MAG: hypothetical protein KR126chlam3_01026, partial [Chlamydiae bacterium]|nr:hypothetical protein [Chlamydiota bacterium]
IDKSLSEMEKAELVPFQALVQSGVDLVMVGHLVFPALSTDPSSLSHEIITGLLREQIGFEGVVITDALNMRALSDHFSIEEVVTKTLLAGTDLLLTTSGKPEVVDFLLETAIPRAIDHILATIPEELIEQKYQRVQTLRKKMLPEIPPEDPEICRTLYRHAVTRIGEEISLGPSIALVQSRPDPIFTNFLKAYAEVDCFSYEEMDKARNYPHVIVQVGPNDCPRTFPDHAIIALFDTPYKLAEMTPSAAVIGYEDVFFAKEAVADVLFGKIPALGKLSVRVHTSSN